jgi:hypothetical protein
MVQYQLIRPSRNSPGTVQHWTIFLLFFAVFSLPDGDGVKSDISFEEKTNIACWAEERIKTADIAGRLGRHPAAVHKHIALF